LPGEVPYFTREVEDSFVFQEITAELVVIEVTFILKIPGGVVSLVSWKFRVVV